MTSKCYVIACDLGTGGNKAALFDPDGCSLAESFVSYPTTFPQANFHEQRPQDWYDAVVKSIRTLMSNSGVNPTAVAGIAISGHSLGCVPICSEGKLLQDSSPIWSDQRADVQAQQFFEKTSQDNWYMVTGNGFPPPLYTVFKVMWLRENHPQIFNKTATIIGTKDYVNFCLTGQIATDHSYASGSGIYDLVNCCYDENLLAASGLDPALFPKPVSSTKVIGTLNEQASKALGLPLSVKVVAGGVDNSCMALGAGNADEGSVYHSLGSSSWLTVTSSRPILDLEARPFIFAHVVPGLYNSALSTFSSGTSLNWMRELLGQADAPLDYDQLFELAQTSPPGANNLLFVPTLAGGTVLEGGPDTRGGLLGLSLSHSRADILRATLEGIAFSLRIAFDRLRSLAPIADEMVIVGGGARSGFWRQIYADIYGVAIVKTNIDQNAGALGAAALGFVGTNLWADYARLSDIHKEQARATPQKDNHAIYCARLEVYRQAAQFMTTLGKLSTRSGEKL